MRSRTTGCLAVSFIGRWYEDFLPKQREGFSTNATVFFRHSPSDAQKSVERMGRVVLRFDVFDVHQ